jgi:hypothetical protein
VSLPNVASAIDGLGDPLTVGVIAKSAQDFQSREQFTRMKEVYGVQVPTQPQELTLLPIGERQWRYLTFYSDDTSLRNDFYVETDDRVQFRVVAAEPWGSFSKYLLQECPDAGSAGEPAEDLAAEASS